MTDQHVHVLNITFLRIFWAGYKLQNAYVQYHIFIDGTCEHYLDTGWIIFFFKCTFFITRFFKQKLTFSIREKTWLKI